MHESKFYADKFTKCFVSIYLAPGNLLFVRISHPIPKREETPH